MAARALTTLLFMPLMVNALEKLDDSSMSNVVAQEGVRLISEFEAVLDNASIIDTDDAGVVSLSNINFGTRVNRQQEIDFKISTKAELYEGYNGAGSCTANPAACTDELGLAFFNRDLPFDMTVGAMEINGKTVASMGIQNFEVNAFSHNSAFLGDLRDNEMSLNVTAFAGGHEGRGINFSIYVPKTAQFEQYVSESGGDGVKFASTVRFIDVDPNDPNITVFDAEKDTNNDGSVDIRDYEGGLDMRNMTVDVVPEGMRFGLPEMTNGVIAITDFRIGNDEIGYDTINDIILKDIDLTGGYLILKPGQTAQEAAINIDMQVNKDTGLTFVYRDDQDQINARISLVENLTVEGASINVHEADGLVLGLGAVKGQVLIDQITLSPNNITNTQRSQLAPLGELTMNLNIAPTSYLHIQGN